MLKEFKAFILRGNVLDLAVAVIIGGAFGQIVSSFVNDIIMPPIGLILGNVDFKSLYLNLSATPYPTLADAQAAGAPTINYGTFINNVVDFLIVAAVIFLVVRTVRRLENLRAIETPPPTTKDCPYCLSTIPILATRCGHCTSQLQA
jgi:large conductance mechanosensitive channel